MSPPIIQCKPKKHIIDQKKNNWNLTIKEKYVLIRDSNLARLPSFNIINLQIDSFPGATARHLYTVMEKIQTNPVVEIMVIAIGIKKFLYGIEIPIWNNNKNLRWKTRNDLYDYHRKIKLAAYFEKI